MQKIKITRNSNNEVEFEPVSINRSENVFFINLDPLDEHWPDLASNKLGKAPSAPSSECQPDPTGSKKEVPYTCLIPGHTETGTIKIFAQLAAAKITLTPSPKGQPIASQQVVKGGKSPYQITGELFEITTGPGGAVIQSGSGIGPGLQLTPSTDDTGVWVTGTPTVSGTYTFTFTVDDSMGANLQQIQYTMVVS